MFIVACLHRLGRSLAQWLTKVPCVHNCSGQALDVANHYETTVYAIADELFKRSNFAKYDGCAAGHRLQRRQGDGLISRRHRIYTAAAEKIAHLGTTDKTMKPYAG